MSIPANRLTNDQAYRMAQRAVLLATSFEMVDNTGVPDDTHCFLDAGAGAVAQPANVRGLSLSVGSTNADRILVQTQAAYPPGRSGHRLYHSDGGATNQKRRWGRFDERSGFFFERSGSELRIVSRSSVSGSAVDTAILSIAWNADPADGTETLPVLDLTLPHKYEIEIPAGCVGPVRFYIDDVLVHTLDGTLEILGDRAWLPSAMEVVNTGASSAGSFTCMHEEVTVEDIPPRKTHAISIPLFTTATTPGKTIGVRVRKLATPANNRAGIYPRRLRLDHVSGSSPVEVYVYGTGNDGGALFTEVNGSVAEAANGADDMSIGGTLVFSGRLQDNGSVDIDLRDYLDRLQVIDYYDGNVLGVPLVLAVQIIGTGGETVTGAITWEEDRP